MRLRFLVGAFGAVGMSFLGASLFTPRGGDVRTILTFSGGVLVLAALVLEKLRAR